MRLHIRQMPIRRRLVSAGLALVLVPVVSVAVATPATAAAPPCPQAAPDRSAAAAMARVCNGRVEVASARTETGRVFANPDGTEAIEEYAYPQRVRRPDGNWADLDATLVANADGSFSPRASIVDLKLSGGGSGSLLTGRRAGTEVSLSWPGRLPAPTVDGASATYVDVLPGVDLVVTALETGFSEVLVVKNRLAAKNPKLRRFAFGSSLSGLRWRNTDGRLDAVDAAGKPVLGATAPRMWDSSASPVGAEHGGRARGDHTGPAEGVASAPMAVTLQNNELTLEPTSSMLDDPKAEYPLYLDPTVGYFAWTMINSYYTNQSYWSFDKWNCPAPFTGECAKVGQAYGESSGMDYRSMWSFSTDAFRGKLITSAAFGIDLLYSAYPSNSQTDLYRVDSALGSGTTWANTSWAWGTYVSSVSNYSKPAARKYTEFGMTGEIQNIANWNWAWVTYGLKANIEYNANGWKKFDATTARLYVSVNTRPNMPDTLTVDGRACASGSARPVISTATPVLKGRVTDPEGHSMEAWYAWAKWNGSSFVDVTGGNNSPHANGAYAQITTGTLEHGGIYTFRMQTNDYPSVGATGYGISDVTHTPGNCEWEVDLQDPAVAVNGDIYRHNSAGCPAEGCGSVGQTGRFTFSGSADVVSYRWGWTDPPSTVLNPSTTGGSVVLDWTPPDAQARTLYVQAVDRSGRTKTTTHQFTVAPPSPIRAWWKLDEPSGAPDLADATGNGWTATATGDPTLGADGRLLPGPDGVSRSAIAFDGDDDSLTASAAAMPDTSRSFSVAAWVRVDDTTDSRSAIDQGGTNASAFWLGATDAGLWEVGTTAADVAGATETSVTGTTPVRPGAWTHLAGVYDSAARSLTLYVNGAAVGTASNVTTWDGNGPLRIGGLASPWKGAIADVQVWNRVVAPAEVFDLVDPLVAGKVAEWHLNDVGFGPSYDGSGFTRDLTFYGDAEIPASGAGQDGTGLRLDGVEDYVSPNVPVLYTDQPFTVSAWVRPTVTTGLQAFLTQFSDGAAPGFSLDHSAAEASWRCRMPASSTDTGATTTVAQTPALDTTDYHHLVCVFDAQSRELRLYLDDQLKDTAAMDAAWQPWRATGSFVIGTGQHESPLVDWTHGDLDEVRIFQGVVADVTRID